MMCAGGGGWKPVESTPIKNWFFLHDDNRNGVDNQRKFVEKALATPDFAFLEGPPGSGKTTVLCEVIQQLVSQKKRVLMCASTHVAVDNLLEKLTDSKNNAESEYLLPVRIGDPSRISEKIKDLQYEEIKKNKPEEFKAHILQKNTTTKSEQMQLDVLRNDTDAIGDMVLDRANLVCGTTMGILKHLDGQFDAMIIDEASKTTFQEFLVPAIHAHKWIIVGDINQLTPYTDQEEITSILDSCLDKQLAEVCLDVFQVLNSKEKKTSIIITKDKDLKNKYRIQCKKNNVVFNDLKESTLPLRAGQIVIGSPELFLKIDPLKIESKISSFVHIIRNYDDLLCKTNTNSTIPTSSNFKKSSHKRKSKSSIALKWQNLYEKNKLDSYHRDKTWSEAITWRIIQSYQNDLFNSEHDNNYRSNEIKQLMPDEELDSDAETKLDETKKIILPSILQILQHGFKVKTRLNAGTAMRDGMPEHDFSSRHVLLEYQHRMHPEIAEFSHKHVYEEKALFTSDTMEKNREWLYDRYANRLTWINVRDKSIKYESKKEAECVIEEIKNFYKYATNHPKSDGTPWEIAVLTFYTKQKKVLRDCIRTFVGGGDSNEYFQKPLFDPKITIQLKTVDSFQGKEADIVFLSLANNTSSVSFLDNRNRINVAVTRGRYQCVIIGNKQCMSKSRGLLKELTKISDNESMR